jgi:hypothetical protein
MGQKMPGNKKRSKVKPVVGQRVKDPKHFKYVTHYRVNVMKVIQSIRDGTVDEDDLDRLQNYVQLSFKMMERMPMSTLNELWRNLEIFGHIVQEDGATTVDTLTEAEIILDGTKQLPKNREERRRLGLLNVATAQEVFAGRPKDHIDEWVDREFTKFEKLDAGEQQMVKNAATFASGIDDVKYDQVLVGNAANTMALHHLVTELQGVVPDKRDRFIHDGMEYALLGYLWRGRKVVICDDLLGVFCSRNTAREIHKMYDDKPVD